MAAFVKYQAFAGTLGQKVHDFRAAGDTLKIALTNTAPNVSTHALLGDITEITPANGYVAGGNDTQQDFSASGGVGTCTGVDTVFTASGGSFGPFRYAVLYNSTPSSPNKPLIGYWDYGSSISLNDTETFTVDFGASMFTLQ